MLIGVDGAGRTGMERRRIKHGAICDDFETISSWKFLACGKADRFEYHRPFLIDCQHES